MYDREEEQKKENSVRRRRSFRCGLVEVAQHHPVQSSLLHILYAKSQHPCCHNSLGMYLVALGTTAQQDMPSTTL